MCVLTEKGVYNTVGVSCWHSVRARCRRRLSHHAEHRQQSLVEPLPNVGRLESRNRRLRQYVLGGRVTPRPDEPECIQTLTIKHSRRVAEQFDRFSNLTESPPVPLY